MGIPGRVTRIWDDRGTRMACVDIGGVPREVCLAYLPDTAVGDHVIVHCGFALTRLDEAAARESLATFRDLGLLADDVTGRGSGS